MKRKSIYLIALIFLPCCGGEQGTNDVEEKKESSVVAEIEDIVETDKPRDPIWYNNDDTLISYCSSIIETAYSTSHPDIELTLESPSIHRDDQVCIVSFEEIQHTGSWTYTNSSLLFLKEGETLLPIRLIPESLSENDPFYFPNRVNGILLNRTDINANGRPEFLFESSEMRRTDYRANLVFYELDAELKVVYPIDMSAETVGIVGECEDMIGQERNIEIHEQEDGQPPIIIIRTQNSRCDQNGKRVITDEYHVNYQWSKDEKKFRQV